MRNYLGLLLVSFLSFSCEEGWTDFQNYDIDVEGSKTYAVPIGNTSFKFEDVWAYSDADSSSNFELVSTTEGYELHNTVEIDLSELFSFDPVTQQENFAVSPIANTEEEYVLQLQSTDGIIAEMDQVSLSGGQVDFSFSHSQMNDLSATLTIYAAVPEVINLSAQDLSDGISISLAGFQFNGVPNETGFPVKVKLEINTENLATNTLPENMQVDASLSALAINSFTGKVKDFSQNIASVIPSPMVPDFDHSNFVWGDGTVSLSLNNPTALPISATCAISNGAAQLSPSPAFTHIAQSESLYSLQSTNSNLLEVMNASTEDINIMLAVDAQGNSGGTFTWSATNPISLTATFVIPMLVKFQEVNFEYVTAIDTDIFQGEGLSTGLLTISGFSDLPMGVKLEVDFLNGSEAFAAAPADFWIVEAVADSIDTYIYLDETAMDEFLAADKVRFNFTFDTEYISPDFARFTSDQHMEFDLGLMTEVTPPSN
ncbi:hypothetical protein [Persicobacter psychrovividus]|uniref:Uncharacterized protein n=1 Tax=Persicobacter psychrovividus TaxID=387638 RepID=A0ABN6LIR9_9BACT|nr:hypothetical protein PEPS_40780 [Persicobacter psychrovividus]